MVTFGVNYMVEFKSIAGALAAYGRGENLPYFGKQSTILPYFPPEQKRKANQDFPEGCEITERGKERNLGLFSFEYYLLKIGEYLVKHCPPSILCTSLL
jgi:hypothetical protein